MDFPLLVANNVDGEIATRLLEWWAHLGDAPTAGCKALKSNIEEDAWFELAADAKVHLIAFAETVSAKNHACPVERARQAIRATGMMVCSGPQAEIEGRLCRLVPIEDVATYHADDDSFEILMSRPLSAVIIQGLIDGKYLNPDKELSGPVPRSFWTLENDLQSYEATSKTIHEILNFLGKEGTNGDRENVLFVLEAAGEFQKHIPTGWDGFHNGQFRCSKPPAKTGWTRDLNQQGVKDGAREVVTRTVPIAKTRILRVYAVR